MKWDELRDLDGLNPDVEIWGTRTKNHQTHRVPLTPGAVAILKAAPRTAGFVFSATGENAVSGFSKVKLRVDRKIVSFALARRGAPPAAWALHDLRRTMVTMMN